MLPNENKLTIKETLHTRVTCTFVYTSQEMKSGKGREAKLEKISMIKFYNVCAVYVHTSSGERTI